MHKKHPEFCGAGDETRNEEPQEDNMTETIAIDYQNKKKGTLSDLHLH